MYYSRTRKRTPDLPRPRAAPTAGRLIERRVDALFRRPPSATGGVRENSNRDRHGDRKNVSPDEQGRGLHAPQDLKICARSCPNQSPKTVLKRVTKKNYNNYCIKL